MKLKLEDIKVCYPTAILPKQNEEKTNIFLGIGLWSKTHGLTAGIPIDLLSMLITADRLRKQIDPLHSKIFIFIADNFALESRADHPEVSECAIAAQRDKTIQLISNLCQLLKIENAVIEDSRVFKENNFYDEIATLVKKKHQALCGVQQLEETTENYVVKQTALIGYYHAKKNCGVKVSWCFDPQAIAKPTELIIQHGIANKKFDELWFDAYYQRYLGDNYPIGFVYTPPGIALNTSSKSTSAPYFAKNQLEYPRILFGDTLETLIGNGKGKIPVKFSQGRSQKKGNVKTEPYSHYLIPPGFKKFMLTLLNELRENYADCIHINSKKDEYKAITIIEDLAKVADFNSLLPQKTLLLPGDKINGVSKSKKSSFFFGDVKESSFKKDLSGFQLTSCQV